MVDLKYENKYWWLTSSTSTEYIHFSQLNFTLFYQLQAFAA